MIQAFRGLILFLFFLGTISAHGQTEPKVFVTKTGAKYHRSTCRYAQTGWEATLTEAKERKLTTCLVCKPGGGSTSTPANSSSMETNNLRSSTPSTSNRQHLLAHPNAALQPRRVPDVLERHLQEVFIAGNMRGRLIDKLENNKDIRV